MSDIPHDIVPQILMKIQDDIASFRRDVTDRFNGVDSRLDRLEAIQKQERRNTAAMLVMDARNGGPLRRAPQHVGN